VIRPAHVVQSIADLAMIRILIATHVDDVVQDGTRPVGIREHAGRHHGSQNHLPMFIVVGQSLRLQFEGGKGDRLVFA
jgi:hypothetical protein